MHTLARTHWRARTGSHSLARILSAAPRLTIDVELGAGSGGSGDVFGVAKESGVVVAGDNSGDGQSDDAARIEDRHVGRLIQ